MTMWQGFLSGATEPLVVQVGMTFLAIHTLFFVLFAYVLPDGPWKKMPGHTAHQAVSFPIMIFISCFGCLNWFTKMDDFSDDRVTTVYDNGVWLGQFVYGFLLYWDIPTSLIIPALQDPVMLAHHIGMLFVAGVIAGNLSSSGLPTGSYYAPFFLGVIESSSIPLSYVDVFHPKHKHWYNYVKEQVQNNTTVGKVLNSINEAGRVLFAVSFLVVRFFYFPFVAFRFCIPDFWKIANRDSDPIAYAVVAATLFFTALQLNWGVLVIKQLAKALSIQGGSSKVKNKNNNNNKLE